MLANGSVRCDLCHHRCVIAEGGVGLCKVRRNENRTITLPYYGRASALSVDPVEKKPLYHFLPGTYTYSIGYVGCNLWCPFCQNYAISQSVDAQTQRVTPESIVRSALDSGCPSVSHTYSEPLVHAEFVIESMKAAKAAGLRSVLVTNGCARSPAADEVLSACDAVNVDIKAWDPEMYRSELGGDLELVKDFITRAFRNGVHVEATTLVIPGKNDDDDQIDGIASFLSSLSPDLPLHISAYRPVYRYTIPATTASTIERLVGVAARHLGYVYAGNVWGETSTTTCRVCGATLVGRRGYSVDASGLDGNLCSHCGAPAPFFAPR